MTALPRLAPAASASSALRSAPGPAFTAEQRAAIDWRGGSYLLAAGAGSGKTAVMVERFVTAVREDAVPVHAILALTFTEKAAGELRERLRRRLTELGEHEAARAVDGGWIGTIHGFCARLLRSRPVAAGLDPGFGVLDEPAATRLAQRAYRQALEQWTRTGGPAALDLAAAYGPGLQELVLETAGTLRARGIAPPRLELAPVKPPAPDTASLRSALAAARGELAVAGAGKQVQAARDALDALELVLDRDTGTHGGGGAQAGGPSAAEVPWPGDLEAGELKGAAKALQRDTCAAYKDTLAAYRAACATARAHGALERLDGLLGAYDDHYRALKAERAAVDFEDLELRARDLLADPAVRRAWAERFELLMVDEFQDTNGLQLEILEALERDNLVAVGDESQSIYRFRHADVGIFRARARALGAERVGALSTNFRSVEPLLDVIDATFTPELGPGFTALRAGREPSDGSGATADEAGVLRLFDPAAPVAPRPAVELLLTDTNGWEDHVDALGLGGGGDPPARRAEARLVAYRLRAEVDGGRRPGEIVVLVRATASLRLLEEALEEQGLPTYVVGGRGYWGTEQVRDGLAWLAVLANPRDESALLTVLASPFCGAGTDALVLLAQAGRAHGTDGLWDALRQVGEHGGAVAASAAADRAWVEALPVGDRERLAGVARLLAAERERAERAPLEVLLERAIAATGYDLAVLARPGGDRRLANLRKLMRLAREFERAEGRDLRGFLADAAARDVAQAREGEAALESEGLDAVRLMTIHRAKGLEFPVVCVADLGRGASTTRPRLLVGPERSGDEPVAEGAGRGRWVPGLRLAALGGGVSVPTAAWEALAATDAQEEAQEERRLFYVAMTRARERLIVSGSTDLVKRPAARPGGPPIDWVARALAGTELGVDGRVRGVVEREWDGRVAPVAWTINTPADLGAPSAGSVLPADALAPRAAARARSSTALPATPIAVPEAPPRPRAVPQRLSYSSLSEYARCPYRWYLSRTLRLPRERAALPPVAGQERAPATPQVAAALTEAAAAPEPISPLLRGSIVHRALEDLDFAAPAAPDEATVRAITADLDDAYEPTPGEVAEIQALVLAFAQSPLRERLARARSVRREAGFSFTLEPDGAGPLVNGFVDVLATDDDGSSALVVDYKTDRLEGSEPGELIARDYETQRLVYALAALRAGHDRVTVAYCLLDRPGEPVERHYSQLDAPELAARLQTLAEGLLAHRFPVTDRPHRELCGDCPGRHSLCSWPESVTLRPAA